MLQRWLWAGAGLATACTGPGVSVDPLPTPPDPPSRAPTVVECTPLALVPDGRSVAPRGFVQLVPSGGSGTYTFAVDPADGGVVEASTWGFLASEVAGDVTVTVSDVRCSGDASVTVEVVSPLRASPPSALLAPGQQLTPTWTGGSDAVACVLDQNQSGASLAGCTYTAGPLVGLDRVRVEDGVLGVFHDVPIQVQPGAMFRIAGELGVVVPIGTSGSGRWVPSATTGSGVLEVEVLSGPFVAGTGDLLATGVGSGEVRVTDVHTQSEAILPIQSVAAVSPSLPRDGERSGQGVALPLGDVDGDGFPDAAIGFIEPGVSHHYGGLVAVYRGFPGGLSPVADQVFVGDGVNWTLGRSLAVGDIDQDGELDLVMGSDRADQGATNNGVVRIHRGIPGGLFEDVPRTLVGEIQFGRFGSSLALCDFDGDSWLDLAVGAMEASDLATAVPADDQGAIQIFWGGPAGFTDNPDFDLFGRLQGENGWEPAAGLELGTSLVAADFDGDGLCDLASGTPELGSTGTPDEGAVFVFAGRDDGTVLSRDPVRVLRGAVGLGSEFGRSLAAGRVDDNARADLLVTAWKQGADNEGAVHLFPGPIVLAEPDPVTLTDAVWTGVGGASFDYFGSSARLDDMNADGLADVVVGAYRAQNDALDQGVVYVFETPALTGASVSAADATTQIEGASGGDRFGQAVAGLGDVNFDTVGDVVSIAGYSDLLGVDVGAVYFGSGGNNAVTALELPGEPSGHQVARSLARIDVDGDGALDLVFGAPESGVAGIGGNSGAVFWASLTGADVGTPQPLLGGHPSHSGADRFGYALAVTDFDGDGQDDLAVVARSDSRTATFPSPYDDPSSCADSAASLTGSVWVYRGTPTGLEAEPAFVWFGPDPFGSIQQVIGGLDHDGDGLGDLVVSSANWEDVGGYAVVYGRDWAGQGIQVLCDSTPVLGNDRFDRLGYSLAPMGDLDGDGCDEFAVGATGEEFGSDWNNQGSVRVLWGHAGVDCATEPAVSTLQLEVIGTGLGSGLAGRSDVDGDGIPDLVVGGAEYRVYFAEHGAFWMVPGSWLVSLPRQTLANGRLPSDGDTVRSELLPNQGLVQTSGLVGGDAAGLYGETVAFVEVDGETLLAVAAPLGGLGGVRRSGGVALHRFEDGIDPTPVRLFVGEQALEGQLGQTLLTWEDHLVVGAPTSSSEGLSTGAFYTVEL